MRSVLRNGIALMLGLAVSLVLCVITESNAQQSTIGGLPFGTGAKGGLPIVAAKESDTARSSVAVTAEDPDLQLRLPNNGATYRIDAYMVVVSNTTADFRYKFDCTSCAALPPARLICSYGPRQASLSVGVAALTHVIEDLTLGAIDYTGSETTMMIKCSGVAKTSAENSVVSINWAQNTSNAGDTVVTKGAWITASRVL